MVAHKTKVQDDKNKINKIKINKNKEKIIVLEDKKLKKTDVEEDLSLEEEEEEENDSDRDFIDNSEDLEDLEDLEHLEQENNLNIFKNLTKSEINTLTPQLELLKSNFKKKTLTELDIINANITQDEKTSCYELLRLINSEKQSQGETETWLRLRNNLYDKLKKNNLTNQELENLNNLNNITNNNATLLEKIIKSQHSQQIKSIIYQKYLDIEHLPKDDENYNKTFEWINLALRMPTQYINLKDIYSDGLDLITRVYENLNKDTYGQVAAKEKILDILSSMWVNPKSTNKCIAFIGPPGTGKTAFAKSFAQSSNLPFYQISFGGATDSSLLKGQSIAYIGAKPGELANCLINLKVKNGVLFLDELDKIQDTSHGSEVSSTLLHILDYEQNKEIKDNYLGDVTLDLSNLIIIISVNSIKNMNKILLDRLQLINFKSYSTEDKINIALNYSIKRLNQELKFNTSDIIISREAITYLILKSKIEESGVRQLNRNLRTIFERINCLRQMYLSKNFNSNKKIKLSYDILNFKLPLILDNAKIDVLFAEYDFFNN